VDGSASGERDGQPSHTSEHRADEHGRQDHGLRRLTARWRLTVVRGPVQVRRTMELVGLNEDLE